MMTALKSTSSVAGTIYVVLDADSNEIVLANGQPVLNRPLTPQVSANPTAQLSISGSTIRLTQANALAWPFSAGQSFTDADNGTVTFVAAPPVYNGGTFESATTGGVRMQFKGLFCDLTATNLTDLDVPLTAFGSSGVIS